MPVELLVGDARFDHRVGQFFVDFENPIHALEDHDDGAVVDRQGRSVTPVAPLARRPERNSMPGGDPDDRRDLVAGRREIPPPRNALPGNRAPRIALEIVGAGADELAPRTARSSLRPPRRAVGCRRELPCGCSLCETGGWRPALRTGGTLGSAPAPGKVATTATPRAYARPLRLRPRQVYRDTVRRLRSPLHEHCGQRHAHPLLAGSTPAERVQCGGPAHPAGRTRRDQPDRSSGARP
jgi:hypothetical protein